MTSPKIENGAHIDTAHAIPQQANKTVDPLRSWIYQVLTSENDTKTSESVYIFGSVSPGIGRLSHQGRHVLLGLFQQHLLGDDCLCRLMPSDPFRALDL